MHTIRKGLWTLACAPETEFSFTAPRAGSGCSIVICVNIYRNTIYMHLRHELFKRQPQPPRIQASPANGHNIVGQFIIRRPLESFGMRRES